MDMLEDCVKVLTENSNMLNKFTDLFYETYNNMARCMNIQGKIQKSQFYLEKAMEYVKQMALEQDPESIEAVRNIPELSLNICNALLYLKNYSEALGHADQAVTSSKSCVTSI